MPALIDLKTNLKSLGYGNDRPDGGSSNQPYVVSPIPDGEAPRTIAPDFLLRNGYLNAINSLDDVKRIGKWFIDLKSPSGLLFTAKQELLERQNVNVNDGINRIYNPLGTVGQVGVLSTGYHLNKQGFNVFREGYYNGGQVGYFTLTNTSNTLGEDKLSLLFKSKISNNIDEFEALAGKNLYGITPSSDVVNLISYSGGPGSVLGIGKTNIRIQNPTQTKKENWSYQNVSEGEETVSIDTSFTPSYQSSTLNIKGYLTPTIKRPSINWQYNFGLDTNTVSFQYYTLYPTDDNSNILYLSDNRLNSPTKYTRGGKPSDVIRKNNRFDIYPSGRSGFVYDIDYSISNDSYLTPFNKHPFIDWFYGIGGIGVSTAFLDDNNKYWTESERNYAELNLGFSDENKLDLNKNQIIYKNGYILDYNSRTFSYEQIVKLKDPKSISENTSLNNIEDFRKAILDNQPYYSSVVNTLPTSSYATFNREKTYKTSVTTYKGNINKDGLRVLDPNMFISPDQTETGSRGEDIIDFNFNIQNLNGDNRLIDFRAYLETWSDGAKAEWSPIKYMGRAESFYKYNGFSRDISVTFLVPALSRGDMILNYKKLNALMWTVAPSYSPTTNESTVAGLMRGSVTKFTMGNYFNGMPCIIKGVDFSEIEGIGWDINRDGNGDIISSTNELYVGQLPKGIKATVNLTPLHDFVPQYGEAFIGQNSKYIF